MNMAKKAKGGTSLVDQQLKLCPPMPGVRLQSLVVELTSHMPRSKKKNQNIKQKRYCDKFNKNFKNHPHQNKSF